MPAIAFAARCVCAFGRSTPAPEAAAPQARSLPFPKTHSTCERYMTLCGLVYCRDAASRACPGCGSCASVQRPLQTTSMRPMGPFISTRRGSRPSCRPSRCERCALQPTGDSVAISCEIDRETADGHFQALWHGSSPCTQPCDASVYR